MTSNDSDIVDEIVQDRLPVHLNLGRDAFLPWHRIRKEYIRRFQWNELTARMIQSQWKRQLALPEEWSFEEDPSEDNTLNIPKDVYLDKTLSCLVIPGEDLLDVRALWQDVQKFKCNIRYLGFNESQGSDRKSTRLHISNNAVTSLPHVVSDSRVVHDRFEAIANESSQAIRYLKYYGPFHVVNLDLCGTIFPNTQKDVTPYYDALHRLLVYQFSKQTGPWLLFVTTVVEPGVVSADGFSKLCGPTQRNFVEYPDFAEAIKKGISEDIFLDPTAPIDLSLLTGDQMILLFGVALGKWLLSLCQGAIPKWTFVMRRSYRFSQNEPKGAEILSLAFELRPNVAPPVDPSGMSGLNLEAKRYPDERECAVRLAKSATNIRDVDALLASDGTLKKRLKVSKANLLESAGYDPKAYEKWVDEGEGAPKK